jgi:hypothetical protein
MYEDFRLDVSANTAAAAIKAIQDQPLNKYIFK